MLFDIFQHFAFDVNIFCFPILSQYVD